MKNILLIFSKNGSQHKLTLKNRNPIRYGPKLKTFTLKSQTDLQRKKISVKAVQLELQVGSISDKIGLPDPVQDRF